MTLALHAYQIRAVAHLHANPRAGLFAEPGMGKTAITLSALTPDHLPALVIAPKRVAEHVWPTEVTKWRSDLTIAVAAGTPAQRRRALTSGADIIVIGRDNVKDIGAEHGFNTVVLDELSSWKNRDTQRWKHTRKITADVDHVFGLTGTPASNGLMDLWAELYLLDNGERLGTKITHFRERWFRIGRQLATGVVVDWILRPGAEEKIHEKIADICLSMRAEDYLDLPPMLFNRLEVDLPTAVARTYEDLRTTLVADLSVLGGGVHTASNAAVLTNRLSQVTAGFLYPDDYDGSGSGYQALHNEKIDALAEIIEGTDDNVLVFYRYKVEAARIKARMGGQMVTEAGAIEAWCRGEIPLLLAHPASAGHGLNLQGGGHTIVWTTCSWSLEEWLQANARLHRQGQERPVIVHQIVVPGTVDEAILDRLEEKVSVQDGVMIALGLPLETTLATV